MSFLHDDGLICPNCKNEIFFNRDGINCPKCRSFYPVLGLTLPLLVKHPMNLIYHTVVQYEKQINNLKNNIISLENFQAEGYRKEEVVENLTTAFNQNIQLLETLKSILIPLIEIKKFLNFIVSNIIMFEQYVFNLNYLRRDWSGLPSDELEIKELVGKITKTIGETNLQKGPILFLGAGLGRIAAEFTRSVQHVYAIDNSLSMGLLFNLVSHKDIEFSDIQLKNVDSQTNVSRSLTASSANFGKSIENVKYIIGDSLNLPFPDGYFSAIVSIYFTDVTPFRKQIREISRVLAPRGKFIHYGPLEYHFEDCASMYSHEEIKEICEASGFELTSEEKNLATHCKSPANEMSRVYTNWLTCYSKTVVKSDIEPNTILAIKGSLLYNKRIRINMAKTGVEASIEASSGSLFDANDSIVDALLKIDGESTFQEIVDVLGLEYGDLDKETIEQLKKILTELITHESVKIIQLDN